jgi:hypothetical protein
MMPNAMKYEPEGYRCPNKDFLAGYLIIVTLSLNTESRRSSRRRNIFWCPSSIKSTNL